MNANSIYIKNNIIGIFLFPVLLAFSSCNTSKGGYSCQNGKCIADFENPQYVTLSDCQSLCSSSSTSNTNTTNTSTKGTVNISYSWNMKYSTCNYAYTVIFGFAYTSSDASNESYFDQVSSVISPTTFSKTLTAGTYYYKIKKTYNSSTCGSGMGQSTPSAVYKTGSFKITAGKSTTVDVSI
ncbi:MAG: hypothetical protein WCK78_19625 [Paludibacter sp.]